MLWLTAAALMCASLLAGFWIGRFSGHASFTADAKHVRTIVTPSPSPSAEVTLEAGSIDLNTAGVRELIRLPGVGETLAGRIVAYREANGPFREPADLMNVDGIGEGIFAGLEEYVTVR